MVNSTILLFTLLLSLSVALAQWDIQFLPAVGYPQPILAKKVLVNLGTGEVQSYDDQWQPTKRKEKKLPRHDNCRLDSGKEFPITEQCVALTAAFEQASLFTAVEAERRHGGRTWALYGCVSKPSFIGFLESRKKDGFAPFCACERLHHYCQLWAQRPCSWYLWSSLLDHDASVRNILPEMKKIVPLFEEAGRTLRVCQLAAAEVSEGIKAAEARDLSIVQFSEEHRDATPLAMDMSLDLKTWCDFRQGSYRCTDFAQSVLSRIGSQFARVPVEEPVVVRAVAEPAAPAEAPAPAPAPEKEKEKKKKVTLSLVPSFLKKKKKPGDDGV